MRITLFLWFAFFCLSATAVAQQRIVISVSDHDNRSALSGATIFLKNQSRAYSTNNSGLAIIEVMTGETISITFVGYKRREIYITPDMKKIDVDLIPAKVDLKAVEVSNEYVRSSINTFSKVDLNIRPVQSSQDFLRIVPGLFTAQHQGGGKAEQIFLRGFDIDHGTDIQISVDGLPVNMVSHAHGQGYADLHFVIPELINNVDYGKGPYSTDHGNLANAGHVSFHTINKLNQSTFKTEFGRYNTFRNVLLLNLLDNKKEIDKPSAYVAAEYLFSDGPFETKQGFNRFNLFGKFNTRIHNNNLLSIQSSIFNSKWSASGQIPERAVKEGLISRFGAIDNTEGGKTSRSHITANLNSNFNYDSYLHNNIFFIRYNFDLLSNFTYFLNDPVNGDRILQKERRSIYGYQGKYVMNKDFGNLKTTTSFGTGFRLDAIRGLQLQHVLNRGDVLETIQNGNINELNISAFADERISTGKWLFNLGVRADQFHFNYSDKLNQNRLLTRNKAITSPKANIYYSLSPKWQLFLKTGKGFHSNDSRVLLNNTTQDILPSSYGADLGFNAKVNPNLLIQFSLWYLQMQQELVYVGDEGFVEPGGRTRRLGTDISVRYQFTNWLAADVDFNIAKPRSIDDPLGSKFIPLAPTFTSTGGLSATWENGLQGSLRYRLISDRPANEINSVTAQGYTVFDAQLNYVCPRYEVGISIENLLNVKWNEAQSDTESRLRNETNSVSELHFTPGTPFFIKLRMAYQF